VNIPYDFMDHDKNIYKYLGIPKSVQFIANFPFRQQRANMFLIKLTLFSVHKMDLMQSHNYNTKKFCNFNKPLTKWCHTQLVKREAEKVKCIAVPSFPFCKYNSMESHKGLVATKKSAESSVLFCCESTWDFAVHIKVNPNAVSVALVCLSLTQAAHKN
jgi:hypothetical protein